MLMVVVVSFARNALHRSILYSALRQEILEEERRTGRVAGL